MLPDIIRVLVAKIVASLVKFAAISIFEMEFRSSCICSPLIEFNESLILMNSLFGVYARGPLKLTDCFIMLRTYFIIAHSILLKQ